MYLDPNFGSMIIQVIIASIAAGGATLFVLKTKLRSLFTSKKDKKDNKDE